MFGLSTVKLVGGGIGILALIALVLTVLGWKNERDSLLEWQHQVIAATVDASNLKDEKGRPAKMKPKDVPQQIKFLGEALEAVRAKTAQAKADDLANARNVENRQNEAGRETSNEYQDAIARVRADYAERLRNAERAARASQSRGGGTNLSGTSSDTSRPHAATEEEGLPHADALIATEQAIQLEAIQRFACRVGLAAPTLCSSR